MHEKKWYGFLCFPGIRTRIEDVFPIEHGDFPASYVSFQGANNFPMFSRNLKKYTTDRPMNVGFLLEAVVAQSNESLTCHTVGGRNPKQPHAMYKTL